ncbi:phage baseplate protein [Paenibacillus cremeus]|uniref:Tat pathway signal sequence domain protein n=1 Tax=Paenibacillus cremeus TaxID=2163881 RepID=A0A559K718_9BACL|nr:Tat pathway signal sequence domain protein [Paenibacillus cremeus]TVY07930.1 Tat pathway signal sequence domain protein [Paenibacillus cremeus]
MNKRGLLRKRRLLSLLAGLTMTSLLPIAAPGVMAERSALESKMFVLQEPASELIRNRKLHNGTVLQSFAIDNVNQRIYVVQLMAGGQKLAGEAAAVSGANRDKNGDLALTQLDMDGNELGYMYLKGFGHGVQIGVEPDGETAYLWTETDSVTEGTSGWGTQIARFAFENGKVLTATSPELTKYRLIEGADRTTVNVDPATNLLTMRYRLNGSFRYGVYNLSDVKAGNYTPVADVPQPQVGTFQGFASYGGYLYLLEGTSYGTVPVNNTYITAVDLSTGEVMDKQLISAGESLTFREPEGMAIRIPDLKHPQKAQLTFGFASDFTPTRLANLYAIDRLLPAEAIHGQEQGHAKKPDKAE